MQHRLRAEIEPLLNVVSPKDADDTRGSLHHDQIGVLGRGEIDDLGLGNGDEGDGGVYTVREEEEGNQVEESLFDGPDLLGCEIGLFDAEGEVVVGFRERGPGTLLLPEEPGDGEDDPEAGADRDGNGVAPIVLCGGVVGTHAGESSE